MKTAILISGQARGFKHIIQNLKDNLLSNFGEIDLFFYLQAPIPYQIEEYIMPHSLVYESDISHDVSSIDNYPYANKQQFLQQWYSLYKCKELMLLSRKDYDLVIRTRPDNDFISPFLLEDINPAAINACSWGGHGGINDRLAVGPYNQMLIYCDFYFHCHRYEGNSESKLESYLRHNHIPIHLIEYLFYRVNEDGQRREHP
jgi:hypothetical protein